MRRVRLGESLVGKVKRLIKKGYERECQSLIGKVQRMVTAGWMTVMAINMCQSLIGKVQRRTLLINFGITIWCQSLIGKVQQETP